MPLQQHQIQDEINSIATQIAKLGPALFGSIKKFKSRKTRKDGSRYVSDNDYYYFAFRDAKGKMCWKYFRPEHLQEIQKWKANGDAYEKLAKRHRRLCAMLALATLGSKKKDPSHHPNGPTSTPSSTNSTPQSAMKTDCHKTSTPSKQKSIKPSART
jgi:hypothetical protein